MNKKIEIQVPEGKVAEEKDNRPVTERIKTLEDACNELGEENVFVQAYRTAEFNTSGNQNDVSDVVAYLKLRVIAEALNEGWEPQFTTDEYHYYPWFFLYTQEKINRMDEEKKKSLWRFRVYSFNGSDCVLAYANSHCTWSNELSSFSARLAVKSKELAEYFGNQFIDIWSDYVALPRKEDE